MLISVPPAVPSAIKSNLALELIDHPSRALTATADSETVFASYAVLPYALGPAFVVEDAPAKLRLRFMPRGSLE